MIPDLYLYNRCVYRGGKTMRNNRTFENWNIKSFLDLLVPHLKRGAVRAQADLSSVRCSFSTTLKWLACLLCLTIVSIWFPHTRFCLSWVYFLTIGKRLRSCKKRYIAVSGQKVTVASRRAYIEWSVAWLCHLFGELRVWYWAVSCVAVDSSRTQLNKILPSSISCGRRISSYAVIN